MADCNNCPSKGECGSQESCTIKNNPYNSVGRVIGVMSGKGGVGKSTISVLIAKELNGRGFKVGVMDADITGPSIPRLLGVRDRRVGKDELGILPVKTDDGISVMSLNLLIENEQQPVIWRGPLIAGTVKQFWEDVFWGDLDYLIIDLPPGTGDVALTVMQSIPISGMLIVSVPQDMVSMIVAKAVNMVKELKIKLIGVVENMSYIACPDCGKKIKMFDGKNLNDFYKELGIRLLGELPMTKDIADIAEKGVGAVSEDIRSTIVNITDTVMESVKKQGG
ncbi:MAG: Mrp/NBP35 family ATP-binding protein [Eubacteriales bacterium]|nr:Mrp/NBP35 family ATP-binding protein [Eubacteriales bacterium]